MTARICRGARLALPAFALLLAASGLRGEEPAAAGDLWEVISHTSVKGSSTRIEPQKSQVCAPKEWTGPPGGDDQSRGCTSSAFHIQGIKATWKFVCKGPSAVSGEGEIYRDSENDYSGTIQYSSDEGKTVVSVSGRRIGQCDKPR